MKILYTCSHPNLTVSSQFFNSICDLKSTKILVDFLLNYTICIKHFIFLIQFLPSYIHKKSGI